MVIVQLLGGMGNQMFQYALGRSLAIKNKTRLKADTRILLDHRPGVVDVYRNYDLDIFKLELERARVSDVWKYQTHGLNKLIRGAHKLNKVITGISMNSEKHFHYDNAIPNLKGNIYLTGFWQSYKYFDKYADIIRKDFDFKMPLNEKAAQLSNQISDTASVCLNVRRTDYISVKSTADALGFIGLDYYKKAVAFLNNEVPGLTYYIFSDDVEWCKENFGFISADKYFVDHTLAGPKFSNYLQLMRTCKYFIIPNSTFAWWGAWLSNYDKKLVITPQNWFTDASINTDDLIPKSWIRL